MILQTLKGFKFEKKYFFESFDSIKTWREEFLTQGNPDDAENFPFVLIGNKLDKEHDRKVSGD